MTLQFTHGHVLLIGIGQTSYAPWSLPATVKDVRKLRSVLVDPNLCAYPDDDDHVQLLHDQKATRQAVLDGLNWLKTKTDADSEATAVVYFSGHGWIHDSSGNYHLIPNDVKPFDIPGSALSAEDFNNALRRISAKRLLVVIDCCHAEGMASSKDSPTVELPSEYKSAAAPEHLLSALRQGEGRAVLSSSRGNQKSWILKNNKLSVFTHHLVEALHGAGNKPGDTVVRLSNVMNHLAAAVPETVLSERQADQRPFFEFSAEDFPIALLRGGKGLSASGHRENNPESEKPSGKYSVSIGTARDVVTGDNARNVKPVFKRKIENSTVMISGGDIHAAQKGDDDDE